MRLRWTRQLWRGSTAAAPSSAPCTRLSSSARCAMLAPRRVSCNGCTLVRTPALAMHIDIAKLQHMFCIQRFFHLVLDEA